MIIIVIRCHIKKSLGHLREYYPGFASWSRNLCSAVCKVQLMQVGVCFILRRRNQQIRLFYKTAIKWCKRIPFLKNCFRYEEIFWGNVLTFIDGIRIKISTFLCNFSAPFIHTQYSFAILSPSYCRRNLFSKSFLNRWSKKFWKCHFLVFFSIFEW